MKLWRALPRRLYLVLFFLILIRVGMLTGFLLGVPETYAHQGWYLHHGGDQDEYIRLAESLARFAPVRSYRTLGFPTILVPFIWTTSAQFTDLIRPVVIFQSIFLFGAALYLLAWLTYQMTRKLSMAILTLFLWTLLPYLIWGAGRLLVCILQQNKYQQMTEIWAVHQMWAQVLSEPSAVAFPLLSLYLAQFKGKYAALGAGATFAFSCLVRPPNALFILPLFYLLCGNNRRYIMWFFLAVLGVAVPQLLYNWMFFRAPIPIYVEGRFQSVAGFKEVFSPGNLIRLFSLFRLELGLLPLVILFTVLFLFILVGFLALSKMSQKSASVVFLWIMPYTLFLGCYNNFKNDIPRFLMPVIPGFILLASSAVTWSYEKVHCQLKQRIR